MLCYPRVKRKPGYRSIRPAFQPIYDTLKVTLPITISNVDSGNIHIGQVEPCDVLNHYAISGSFRAYYLEKTNPMEPVAVRTFFRGSSSVDSQHTITN